MNKSKRRLKAALERLQNAIEMRIKLERVENNKVTELEIENNELRANIILLKKEIAEFKAKLKNLAIENEQKTISRVANDEAQDSKAAKINILAMEPVKSKKLVRKTVKNDQEGEDNNDSQLSLSELKNIAGN